VVRKKLDLNLVSKQGKRTDRIVDKPEQAIRTF
jgi:hypothetical protein